MTDYTRKWKEYKLLRRDWLLCLTIMPVAILIEILTLASRSFIPYALVVWFLAISAYTKKLVAWPCPRCGEPFGKLGPETKDVSWYLLTIFAKNCGHCGLQEFAAPSAESTASALPHR
jgi:hypothetical protein